MTGANPILQSSQSHAKQNNNETKSDTTEYTAYLLTGQGRTGIRVKRARSWDHRHLCCTYSSDASPLLQGWSHITFCRDCREAHLAKVEALDNAAEPRGDATVELGTTGVQVQLVRTCVLATPVTAFPAR